MSEPNSSTAGMIAASPKRRRWPSFSLRAFLVVSILLSSWIGWRLHAVRTTDNSIRVLTQSGARVGYGHPQYERAIGIHSYGAPAPYPYWLKVLAGEGEYDRAVTVTIGKDWNDATLLAMASHMKNLGGLQELNMRGASKISSTGLQPITALRNIEYISMDGSEFGDDALVHVAALRKLRRVGLHRSKVTESGVRYLRVALRGCNVVTEGGP